MAKELPYFKFNASEWISGEITLEDLVTQGAFINICAYYWFKSGSITLTEIKRRLKLKQSTIDSLVNGGHIKLNGDAIEITFLREQFDERGLISKRNSENGKKGGAPKGNSNAKNEEKNNREQPKSSNIEEEKEENRTEEKREDEIKRKKFSDDYYQSKEQAFEEIKQDDLYMDEVHRLITGKGWRVATKVHALKILKKFLIGKADLETDKKNVRQHFKNYLFKEQVSNLVQIADEG